MKLGAKPEDMQPRNLMNDFSSVTQSPTPVPYAGGYGVQHPVSYKEARSIPLRPVPEARKLNKSITRVRDTVPKCSADPHGAYLWITVCEHKDIKPQDVQ